MTSSLADAVQDWKRRHPPKDCERCFVAEKPNVNQLAGYASARNKPKRFVGRKVEEGGVSGRRRVRRAHLAQGVNP